MQLALKTVFILQEKKIDLKESLIADLEEKKRNIEVERSQLELTGGHCHFLLSASLGRLTSTSLGRQADLVFPLNSEKGAVL